MTAEPLTADQERLLRFARSINGGLLDASPVETIDRLLATLDRERAELRSATKRYEDAEHNLSLLVDDVTRERAERAALRNENARLRETVRILQDNWPKTIPAPMDRAALDEVKG